MEVDKTITSFQNPLVKTLLRLKQKSKERIATGRFVIEGQRELALALRAGYTIETVIVCRDIAQDIKIPESDGKTVHVAIEVYEKVAHRGSTEGILAVAKERAHDLGDLQLGEQPLILVAEAPEKPGNIGALLRTADAAGLDAVLLANPKTDLYNPNSIRSSVGTLFSVQIGMGSTTEIIAFLKHKRITIFCAALSASKSYLNCRYTQSAAIVVGTEATGLSAEWLRHSDQNIIIPMQGEIDSLNVSVSAAILIFEAKRQRRP